ncbi:Ribosomal RNA small subunit methyltransferase E [Paracidovorax avenae ATCC 19860]|uniref:Ribosomal RNA small subunit methyltransferase E n=1 Tax=Paracidovorax avenae (strain ATCC 19860 / DSM 7227 / CCUG 15838 / JCM 20985 / LMG 2117 / NCPPB 1011) TaxID=643561 RepID=F0QCP4_PARA1|nr:Ribosomal RNA small subunit methyltransferase E [Paracidovorax avenae ATCC 19860]AVS65353.1 16S rRNA (uracil(1498)-N(3))-methyltransferase [Paracidovorax avenae]AVS79368.1 16S rRNA (uracil(1498)-N(3))-methyltransferase [Paracidovorax avenae]AVS97081.1 16S rRNA (uracil(1498)-N(3))-methyltransferase [Paracidovorax avenae]AVT04212.1 16S rRNA (uracil(1498)-N(3))-methyltransferase [Paracidovorax avenae]
MNIPRFHCPEPLSSGAALALPPAAARHVQVLRLQPGDAITLFDGRGGEYAATVARMGRSDVEVLVGAHDPVEREAGRSVHLVVGMPANERMDWLVEKATELGVARIQPVAAARSVLKLSGERALKRQAHWQAIAAAACEQCGRNRVPQVEAPVPLADWLRLPPAPDAARLVLSLREGSRPLHDAAASAACVQVLHGPEGGLAPHEEDLALERGFLPASLGPRVLRAETASVAALSLLACA